MLSPGVQLGNRYRLDERIASGGMGDVWRGTDQVLGRVVAVKSLLPALLDEPGFAERFRGEARTMATINHPGVVDIYDFGSDQQIAFLIMEYVEGDALSATLNRVGRLTPARTMALVAQAADALHAAHGKGIVHRDVKPGNLLVRPNGTLVLTDFGIARSELVGQLTAAGSVLGTASYISPEQAAGAVATPASDVYALGVVAYQCLAGRRPFEGDNPLEIAMRHVRETPRPLPADIPRRSARSSTGPWPRTRRPAGRAPPPWPARPGRSRPPSPTRTDPAVGPGRSPWPPPRRPCRRAPRQPGRRSRRHSGSTPARRSRRRRRPGRRQRLVRPPRCRCPRPARRRRWCTARSPRRRPPRRIRRWRLPVIPGARPPSRRLRRDRSGTPTSPAHPRRTAGRVPGPSWWSSRSPCWC